MRLIGGRQRTISSVLRCMFGSTNLQHTLGAPGPAERCQAVDEFSVLKLPGEGWEGYLASLDHKRRSVVKRDIKQLQQLDLVMKVSEATKVIAEAAPLVWNIKNRHGIPDHIVLVEDRLGDWAANPVGERVAFTVHDSAGQLLAVSFGCLHRNVLEMSEIGLLNDSTIRQLVYAEVLLYAPIRMASVAGGTEISLGLGSVIPKKLRGATVSKVWAVGQQLLARWLNRCGGQRRAVMLSATSRPTTGTPHSGMNSYNL